MHQEHDPGPLMGLCACDAQLFGQVWERVERSGGGGGPVAPGPAGGAPQPGGSGASPVRSDPPQEPPVETPPSAPGPEPGGAHVPAERPAAGPGEGGDDFPPEDDLPCLGSGSAGQGGQLQTYIREELEGWQLYRLLARRVNGPRARTLAALASEKHRCARRLAAAYFLISGVRYWPTDRLDAPALSAWLGVLRGRFALEQRREYRYRAALCDTCDPCLRELYGELAADCARHAAAVRALLESAL